MEYKAQYQEYLLQATAALDAASARFLPEESEVCRAARYSLLGGGKRSCGDAALLLVDP